MLALPIIAAVVTLFRLAERMRQRRLWFDDACAALALMFNIIESITGYLFLHNYGKHLFISLWDSRKRITDHQILYRAIFSSGENSVVLCVWIPAF